MSRGRPLEVAIVGMGCRFPGAPDLFAYWENFLAGRDGIVDAAALKIVPGTVEAGEPAPFFSTDAAAAALADAGLTPDDLKGRRVKVVGDRRNDLGSGLLALEKAASALATREADLAIAGDVSIAADGPLSGVLVLKRHADAERDGDRIYAVVREVLDAGSSMIGRAMPAAGMAGLIQAALALYHRALPTTPNGVARPWIHADPAVPRRAGVSAFGSGEIDAHALLEEHAASADAEPTAGAGNPGALLRWETEAILLAAPDRAGLADRARELVAWLEHHPSDPLKDIAYTLNGADARAAGGARLGLVASSREDLAARLTALVPRLDDPSCRAIGDARGTYYWDEPIGGAGGLAFLFPGEGSQYPGMLADLCLHFPEVRKQFDTADRIALELGDTVPPSEHVFGRDGQSDGAAGLWSAPTAVNVVLNAQWALFQVLTRLGLRPDAVAGHSSGEILALAAAGVLQTDRELERQLGRLGAIFRGLEAAGGMPAARLIAVAADRNRVEAACRAVDADEVAVAIDNCPHQVVLAGPPAEVERVVGRLRGENILLEVLPFDRAYHTPGFAAVLGPIAESFAGLTFRTPAIPVYSCATRVRMPADPEAIRELAVAQWTRTVAFRETVEAMHADGLRIFVDVGARGNLAAFVQDILRGRPAFAIAANLPRRSGLTQLNHLVAALFAQGVPIRPEFLYARRRPRLIDGLAPEQPARPLVEIKLGFPEMSLDEPPIDRLSLESRLQAESDHADRLKPGLQHPRWGGDFPGFPGVESAFPGRTAGVAVSSETDTTMLAFQETMRAFLETQYAVIGTYLGLPSVDVGTLGALHELVSRDPAVTTSGAEPGPWVGEVRGLVPGSEIEAAYLLDGRDDPIAEHHTLGGRRVSALDPTRRGLPVLPFAVMAEMTAQAAALVVSPGLVLTKLERVHAHKWVRYEDSPVVLELHARREPATDRHEQHVRVAIYNRGLDGRAAAPRPVFEAVAVFAGSTPPPPPASPWDLDDPRPSRFTAGSLYGEQWLFHGPAFQALVQVGALSGRGIDGVLRVLPWEPLLRPGRPASLHTDLIVLDSFTHLLGCWGLDELADGGDVVFPLRMEELELFGDRPPVGTDVACRIAIEEVQRHRIRVAAEIVRPDGTVWMRLRDWEDWRFHWPSRYRDVFRQPQDVFLGEELPMNDPAAARAVWLAPPADMGRPVWRDVLEATQLGPAERAEHLAPGDPEQIRSHRLWGRIAAKEAARRIWRSEGRGPSYPSDLAIVDDDRGRPILTRVDAPADRSLPAIAIAEAEGVAVAIAARDPRARVGIDVELISDRPGGFEESRFTPGERALLARWSGSARADWITRFGCARAAAARAVGTGPAGGAHAAEVVRVDEPGGVLHVRPGPTITEPLRVASARRGDYAWAWTLVGGVEP